MTTMKFHHTIYLALSLCALAIIQIQPVKSLGGRRANTRKDVDKIYGPGFYNHSGCLYAFIGGGQVLMTTADGHKVNETLDLDTLIFESGKTRCLAKAQSGKFVFSFKLNHDRVESLTISMRIAPADSDGYWDVGQANLTVVRTDLDKKRTFPLRLPNMYAGSSYSYSCSELELFTQSKRKSDTNETKGDASAMISLERFQLQPFGELKRHVFAKSYDCSSWITIPGVMGLVLILFMLAVTVLGTILLKGIETNDFKFNREGLMFTQQQQETNKTR